MAFNANGDKIYAGYKGVIRRFEVNRPGAQISQLKTYGKSFWHLKKMIFKI